MSGMKLGVMGAAGRMGQTLIRTIMETEGCELGGASEIAGSPALGQDAGSIAGGDPLGVEITDDLPELFTHIDGVLDFTRPDATIKFVELSAQARIVHVIGTTGLDDEQEEKIRAGARHATIIKAGNMSLGVNLLAALTEQVAKSLDQDFDIEIVEMHHRHKVDAPSGTSLMLGEAAARGRDIDLESHAIRSRDGHTGPRPIGNIGFATMRGGNVVGDHSVIFAGAGERIELTHRADDRSIFAQGAVKAALWGQGRKPGLYAMRDVLGLS